MLFNIINIILSVTPILILLFYPADKIKLNSSSTKDFLFNASLIILSGWFMIIGMIYCIFRLVTLL